MSQIDFKKLCGFDPFVSGQSLFLLNVPKFFDKELKNNLIRSNNLLSGYIMIDDKVVDILFINERLMPRLTRDLLLTSKYEFIKTKVDAVKNKEWEDVFQITYREYDDNASNIRNFHRLWMTPNEEWTVN